MEGYVNEGVIRGGINKEVVSFKWVIENFDCILKGVPVVYWQNLVVTGQCGDEPLLWEISLSRNKFETSDWLGILLKHNCLPPPKDIYTQLEVTVENKEEYKKQCPYFFNAISGVRNLKTDPAPFVFEAQRMINLGTPVELFPLVNGALTIHFKLYLYTNKNPTDCVSLPIGTRVDPVERQRKSVDQFLQDFQKLYEESRNKDSSCDIKILIVSRGGIQEKELHCHKQVLSARSPVFAKMLGGSFIETKEGLVKVTDVTFKTMEILMEHLYTCDIKSVMGLDASGVVELAYAAEKYELNDLHKFCDEILPEKCSTKNCFVLLDAAAKLNLNDAVRGILKFVKTSLNGKDYEDLVMVGNNLVGAKRIKLVSRSEIPKVDRSD